MKTMFGKNLRALRENLGLSQRKLATKLEVTHATIAGYENSCKYPQRESIRKGLIKALQCTEEELFGYSDGYYNKTKYIQAIRDKKVKNQNGRLQKKGNLIDEYIETYTYEYNNNKLNKIKNFKKSLDKDVADKYPKGYFIKIEDDSMDRYIAKNSYVYISKTNINDYDGHVCAVTTDGYNVKFRRVKFLDIDNLVSLIPQSNNEKYKTETCRIKHKEDFKILGRALWFSNNGGDL